MFGIRRSDFLVSLYIFCIIASELMGGKVFHIVTIGGFSLNASVAIFLLPLIFTVNDIFAEVEGKERTKSLIRAGLIMVALCFIASWLFTVLPPAARSPVSEAGYDNVFQKSMRFSLASLIAFAIAEFTDVFVFVKIRQKLGSKGLWFRNNASNFVSQLLDTVIFMTLAFYAFNRPFGDNASFLLSIIVPYWLLKCSMSVIETPFVYLGVRWLKKDKDVTAAGN